MVKNFWMRFLIVIVGISFGFAVIAAFLYSWAWFHYVGVAQKQIESFWKISAPEYSLTLTGETPQIGGYPMVPSMEYSGKIMHSSGFSMDVPALSYSGFPAPAQLQVFKAPSGMTLVAPMLGRTMVFKDIALDVVMPRSFPKSSSKEDMAMWQQRNEPVIIQALDLTTSSNMHLTGSGMIGLDAKLQLAGMLNARIVGMDALLDELDTKGNTHQTKDSGIARQFLKMLSATDPVTGETYFEITLRIQDGSFYFGPLRFARIPPFDWGDNVILQPRLKP